MNYSPTMRVLTNNPDSLPYKNMKSSFQEFGEFDEDAGCFRLFAEPPAKWWNLHCTTINHNGTEMYADTAYCNDGVIRVRDADGTTVNLVGYDQKYSYVRDDETRTTFSPSGLPVAQAVEGRKIEFFREKTVMESSCEGLRVQQRVFVPQQKPIECTTITVTNETERNRKLSIFHYVMFQLSGVDREGVSIGKDNFAEVDADIRGVIATNRHKDCPTDRFKGFLITLDHFYNGNAYRDHFTRNDYSTSAPKILWGWDCDGRPGAGPDCAGIIQTKLTLQPGETKRVDFIIGQCSGKEEILELRESLSPAVLDAWCAEAARIEADRAEAFKIDVGHELYNGLFNIFLKKQLYNYLINKSGFRDNLQTDIALAMADPQAAEQNFTRALASQYKDGSVPHGFRPLNRLKYSDKPAWILQVLPALVKETGNFGLLEVNVPYFESQNTQGSILDHAMRALRFLSTDVGKHGLCKQHHADWNDGLEATEEAGERESVFVSMQLCLGARELSELCARVGESELATECNQVFVEFKRRINAIAWDGEWYIRTLCEDGYRIGSKESEYGQFYLNPQSWAVLSGVAEPQRARSIMERVDQHLESDIGYRICFPPYAQFDPRVGRMSQTKPGENENGGCYNHAAGFKGLADCLLGRSEQAWRTFVKVTPDNPENPISSSGAEPFCYVNSFSSVSQIYGQKGNPWRTGTSGWMAQLMVEHILGAKRGYDGLVIDPCLPACLPEAKVSRSFRGAHYDITLHNRPEGGKSPKAITLNGDQIEGTSLPLLTSGRHQVEVVM